MVKASRSHATTSAYAEAVHWHHNLFLVPLRKAGTSFVTHLAELFCAFGEGTAIMSIALRAAIVIPILHARSEVREHLSCLN